VPSVAASNALEVDEESAAGTWTLNPAAGFPALRAQRGEGSRPAELERTPSPMARHPYKNAKQTKPPISGGFRKAGPKKSFEFQKGQTMPAVSTALNARRLKAKKPSQ